MYSGNLAVRVKSLFAGLVFNKMIRLSPAAQPKYAAGYLVSLVAVDCTTLSNAATSGLRLLVGFLSIPFVLYTLHLQVGMIPVLCCGAWNLLAFLLLIPSYKIQQELWRRILGCRDARLKKMTDLLSCVRLVKFYAWEDTYADFLMQNRRKEVKQQFLANLSDGFVDTMFLSTSTVMTIILFATLAMTSPDKVLTASVSFSSLYALSILDPANTNMVALVRVWILSYFAIKRIATLYSEDERHESATKTIEDTQLKDGDILMTRCSFSWHSKAAQEKEMPTIVLQGVNIGAQAGELVGVVGFVGSGKSALLRAIQGEMHQHGGYCGKKGPLACVPQAACIYSMSIRDNILFGKHLDVDRYTKVLDACDLRKDIACFPAGDLTEVGEKGATLSGGQKQRIALARAAYSDSSIYLLDDTLSALDVQVASRVFERVIGKDGLLSSKTRIVVCNQSRYVEQMDRILLVDQKQVISFQTFEALIKDSRCPKTINETTGGEATEPVNSTSLSTTGDEIDSRTGRITADEVSLSNTGTMDLFMCVVKLSGPWPVLGFFAYVIRGIAIGMYLNWIKQWAAGNAGQEPTSLWVTGLVAFCLMDVLAAYLGTVLLAVGFQNLSGRLHHAMLRCLLASPVPFFDTTPRGRVLNRFSTDLEYIDSRVFLATKLVMQTFTAAIAKITVTGLQAPTAGLLSGITVAVFLVLLVFVSKASNAARRIESVEFSRLLQHVAETRDSLSMVWSYGVEGRFCAHCYRLVDSSMRALLTFLDCSRTFRFLGGICGFLGVLATVTVALFGSGPRQDVLADGGTVGLALISSMAIPLLIMGCTTGALYFFQTFVSLERCLEYTRLPPEIDTCEAPGPTADEENKSPLPCELVLSCTQLPNQTSWPPEGKLEFDNYTASYKPGILPDVLSNISFVANPREKVGVVGRTGAGKSSLVMAILRVLTASSGSIRIDDVDIKYVPLKTLRSVITVIPQDPCLVQGTIRDAVDPTRRHSDDEVWRVLNEAHLAEFVAQQSTKLHMEVGYAGGNLSAGQRQLVCLARALLRKPRVLLLDEATSHMDGDTDKLIQSTVRQCFSNCTVLTIAHRLNTILDNDKVLVLESGRVLEFGPTQELALNTQSNFHAMLRAAGLKWPHAFETPGHHDVTFVRL
ncbi:ATP-binding cassette sub-family C member 2-like [Haemaphysalis longicornis]